MGTGAGMYRGERTAQYYRYRSISSEPIESDTKRLDAKPYASRRSQLYGGKGGETEVQYKRFMPEKCFSPRWTADHGKI